MSTHLFYFRTIIFSFYYCLRPTLKSYPNSNTQWLWFHQDGTPVLFYGVPSMPGRLCGSMPHRPPGGRQPTIATSALDGTS